jgi:hypothetical protein
VDLIDAYDFPLLPTSKNSSSTFTMVRVPSAINAGHMLVKGRLSSCLEGSGAPQAGAEEPLAGTRRLTPLSCVT